MRLPRLTNENYVGLLKTLRRVSGLLETLLQTLITTFGVTVVLVLLLIVEQRRVTNGILLFEHEKSLAHFASFSLVILNMTLEFLIHHIETTAAKTYQWSIRLWARAAAYTLGIGQNWQPAEHSPGRSLRRLQTLVTFAILALALAGSMQGVMAEHEAAWHEALIAIATDSTLIQITSWMGGLLFTGAAVMATQRITAYLAVRTREIYQTIGLEAEKAPRAALEPLRAAYIANCDECDWTGQYDNPESAAQARRGHQTIHKKAMTVPNGNGHH